MKISDNRLIEIFITKKLTENYSSYTYAMTEYYYTSGNLFKHF